MQVHLDSGVQRAQAHRFYFREGMTVNCFYFWTGVWQPGRARLYVGRSVAGGGRPDRAGWVYGRMADSCHLAGGRGESRISLHLAARAAPPTEAKDAP